MKTSKSEGLELLREQNTDQSDMALPQNEKTGQDRVDVGQLLPGVPAGSTASPGIPRPPSGIVLTTGCPHSMGEPNPQTPISTPLAILDALATGNDKGGDFVLGRGTFCNNKVGEVG